MELTRRRRWSDHDHHFGPLTFAFDRTYRPFAITLSSGCNDRESPGCCIRFQVFGATVICELPQIVKPWRRWVEFKYEKVAAGDGYWDEHPREYGFSLHEGFFRLKLGAQTHSSDTTQDWTYFLPWTEWRQVAHRIYNADGSVVGDFAKEPWDRLNAAQEAVTKSRFVVIDYDGERIEVETYVEEREWRRGVRWFRWLGFIVPKNHRRSLDIRFKSEVGPEKGSWKGGMTGHSIEMLPDESQERAFRRYCEQDHRSKHRRYRIAFADAA